MNQTYGLAYPKAIPGFLADLEIFYNELLDPAQVPAHLAASFVRFTNVLKENRLLTFGEMIREAVFLLRRDGNAQLNLQALYVDEFQDVNPAQVALIKAMLPENGKLIGVGDDLQCIYQWRGSDVGRILNFKDDFAPATIFRLTENYRARPEIVELGNAVANNVLVRDAGKQMQAKRPPVEQSVVHFISTESESEQALAVVKIVSEFHAQGLPWNFTHPTRLARNLLSKFFHQNTFKLNPNILMI